MAQYSSLATIPRFQFLQEQFGERIGGRKMPLTLPQLLNHLWMQPSRAKHPHAATSVTRSPHIDYCSNFQEFTNIKTQRHINNDKNANNVFVICICICVIVLRRHIIIRNISMLFALFAFLIIIIIIRTQRHITFSEYYWSFC